MSYRLQCSACKNNASNGAHAGVPTSALIDLYQVVRGRPYCLAGRTRTSTVRATKPCGTRSSNSHVRLISATGPYRFCARQRPVGVSGQRGGSPKFPY